ncbi:DUF6912 family protein [Nocardiopsis sp. CNT312]|uniref:DUF6912 family protein n=1 Tax=Nocardiopsis sp. CNT312 TaxID=1137268 RepID=UPI000490F602|nr:hypothetical protein [Nocardiopsis sp. CNT312]
MYVFLPSTVPALARALEEGSVPVGPAFTAAPGAGADEEEADYGAMYAAAEESLALLAADPGAPRRRVVLAANLPDRAVEPAGGAGPGVLRVRLKGPVPYKRLASAHVDDERAADDIATAAADPASGAAEDRELMWFAVQELRYLVGDGRT